MGGRPDLPAWSDPDPTAEQRLLGRVLEGRYRVLQKVGEGGVGTVYLAEQVRTGKRMALKVLQPSFRGGSEIVDSFLDEALTVSRIGHDHVVDIYYGARRPEGLAFLAMEYLDGTDLGRLLEAEGPLPWPRTRRVLLQVASALDAAHGMGIVHRDIKPQNIMLTRRNGHDHVTVLDFGVAQLVVSRDQGVAVGATAFSGAPYYISPEHALGRPIDRRADIYSLGCVMYHMLTGGPPFQAGSPQALVSMHGEQEVEPPSKRRPDLEIPASVEAIVLRAMEKEPERRFQTMAEMGDALRRCRFASHDPGEPAPVFRLDDPQPILAAARRRVIRRTVGWTAALVAAGALYVVNAVLAGL
jgi:serine/threonine-protein kinase